ncbi:immunoreactive manno protein MP88 [Flammula alnicola]|nr:immunoreactive manno protein MP88 [Flammula alnicola]
MLHASLSALATLLVSLCLTPNMVAAQTTFFPGVLATGTMGPTNPPQPTLGTAINQTSMARLLSLNSIDDFCLFAPPTLQNISDSETIEVAWCTQQRNNARLIPDGTISGVSFLKTDMYIQLLGFGDLTKLNIPAGDFGGELDPHGAFGSGNPIGGNVTSNITGADENFAEWMLYIDDNQFCIRVCTNANSTYSAANMCWHELDEMGCEFVMPGNYNVNGTL